MVVITKAKGIGSFLKFTNPNTFPLTSKEFSNYPVHEDLHEIPCLLDHSRQDISILNLLLK